MSRSLILAAALFVACAPSEGDDASHEVLNAYQDELDELLEVVDAYVAAVGSAADTSAVTDLQTTYDADADHVIEEIGHVLDDVEGCSHMGDGATSVVDARGTLQAMHEALEDVLAAHELHVDVADCVTTADEHSDAIGEEMAVMTAHQDDWTDMTCEMHDDPEAGHSD